MREVIKVTFHRRFRTDERVSFFVPIDLRPYLGYRVMSEWIGTYVIGGICYEGAFAMIVPEERISSMPSEIFANKVIPFFKELFMADKVIFEGIVPGSSYGLTIICGARRSPFLIKEFFLNEEKDNKKEPAEADS